MTQEEFLKDVSDWSNHRHLLWPALEATKGSQFPVLEMGCGDGSTPFLKQYCQDNNRHLRSIDNNPEWSAKFGAELISSEWSFMQWFYGQRYSVVLIDHAPGEKRKEALELFASYSTHFQIIVIHDSEPKGWNASDYRVRELFTKFKYTYDLRPKEKMGAWATALSNTIDVSKWKL